MHLACRRGYLDVVTFLVCEAGVPVLVRDDYGRTPMHDACWSTSPNLELMEFLLRTCPDLLLLSDVRGHLPFSYVRKEHWKAWIGFLEQHRDLLRPKLVKEEDETGGDTDSGASGGSASSDSNNDPLVTVG